ncbi:MAG: ArnT family glycosyltransferase [Candidatus Komeilibacteria bacterium]
MTLIVFFVLTYWNTINSPLERDEGEYAYTAQLLDQGIMPYEHSFLQKPPMIVYTYWLGYQLDSTAVWPFRLLGILFTLATMVLLAAIAKKLYGQTAAWITAWLAIPMLSPPFLTALNANTEKFMLLPLVGLLYLFLKEKEEQHWWRWLLAGSLFVLALGYKPIALLPGLFIIILSLIHAWRIKKNITKLLSYLLLGVLGGITTGILMILVFWLNNALPYLWESAIQYNTFYASNFGQSFPGMFMNYAGRLWQYWWPLILITVCSLWWRPIYWRLWWGLILLSLLTVFTSPIGHYYLLLMPWWCLLTVATLRTMITKLKINQAEWLRITYTAATSIVIIIIIWPFTQQYFLSPRDLSDWIYGNNNPFVAARLIAPRIQSITKPDDKIFVAGSEPEIYYYSQRISASRFDITYPLNINTPVRDQYQQQAITDLQNNPPAAIVIVTSSLSNLWDQKSPRYFIDYLNLTIQDNYQLIGAYVNTNQGIKWFDKNAEVDWSRASLILFQRHS